MAARQERRNYIYPEQLNVLNDKGENIANYQYNSDYIIGSGAMAQVLEGVDKNGNLVAVRILLDGCANKPFFKEMLFVQAKMMFEINNKVPGAFVETYSFGQTPDGPCQVMERLDEDNFVDELIKKRKVDKKIFLDIIKKTAQVLSEVLIKAKEVHGDLDAGAIHYDLESGELCLIDPLPSQSKIEHGFQGSPGGIAPENLKQGSAKDKSDVYALGGVIYHMLTGKKRFSENENHVKAELRQHVSGLAESEKDEIGNACLKLGLDPHLMVDLVTAMVSYIPEDRPTMDIIAKVVEEIQVIMLIDDIPMDQIDTVVKNVQQNKVTRLFSNIIKKVFEV